MQILLRIYKTWSVYRWLRLGLGIYFIYEAFHRTHLLAGAFGALMLYQAYKNSKFLPCEVAGSCTTDIISNTDSDSEGSSQK